MFPEGVTINALTGAVTPSTGEYTKRLSEFRGIYRDVRALDDLISVGDLVTYRVVEYRAEGSDIFFGTTTMMPGRVGDEYFMTRGHYHARRDRGEIYYTQSGQGMLLLQTRDGETPLSCSRQTSAKLLQILEECGHEIRKRIACR